MLSTGSRIGSNRILKWIREGACGQSYQGEQTEGENKGKTRFLKLMLREISERPGFEDFFIQECQAIEQLQGRGRRGNYCTTQNPGGMDAGQSIYDRT